METEPNDYKLRELRFLTAYYQLVLNTKDLNDEWRELYQERADELSLALKEYENYK